jgi:hypothetical protein
MVEEKLYLGVCEQKRLNTTGLENITQEKSRVNKFELPTGV